MKPEHADSFIDDLFGMGPPMHYMDKSIPKNPNIHQFIYEGVQVFQRLVSLVEMAGVTISGKKLVAATPALMALGTIVGRTHYAQNNGEDTQMARMPIDIGCLWFLRNSWSHTKMDQEFCKNCITINNAHKTLPHQNIQLEYRSKRSFQTIKIPC